MDETEAILLGRILLEAFYESTVEFIEEFYNSTMKMIYSISVALYFRFVFYREEFFIYWNDVFIAMDWQVNV